MSANRIVKRRAFMDSQPRLHAYMAAERKASRGEAAAPARRQSYHEYAIESGDRHPSFHRNVRAARAEHGLQPTSSDMAHVHGRRIR